MEQYILAHDLGTSGNKAVLYCTNGILAASEVVSYQTSYPYSGWAEQDPEDWWRAVCLSTKRLLQKTKVMPENITSIVFSGQMMGCLLVDRAGFPLRRMIIWADTRAKKQEKEMIDLLGMDKVYRITGHRVSASYSAAKLMWIREHEPEVYEKAYKMLQAKDYIIHRMTGNFVTDYSDASGTNLFDLCKKQWSEEICSALDIPEEILPTPHPSSEFAGLLTQKAAEACGLTAKIPVVIGGGDGSCACVGAGVVAEGNSYCVLGSSSWISMADKAPVYDQAMRTFNWVHLNPELYSPCGTMQAAGISYDWYCNAFCGEEQQIVRNQKEEEPAVSVYSLLEDALYRTRAGSGGIVYLPYLLGERSPRWNHVARGAFLGMGIETDKAILARAVLEGVGFNLKVILDSLETRQPVEKLTVIGGGARGRLWLQILSDIWQNPLEIPAYPKEATSLGAAVCAGVATGIFSDYSIVRDINCPVERIQPKPENAELYRSLYSIFNQAYEKLVPVYASMAKWREDYSRI